MKDLTLVTVNWNQQPCLELLLKSYVKYHYKWEKLMVMIVDNGSTDGSKEWLKENEIPFLDLQVNVGHENGLNLIYKQIKTQYCLLNDTDIEYHGNVYQYLEQMKDNIISVGEMIDNNYMQQTKIKDRITPWFWLFDIIKMRENGIEVFRDSNCEDWTYDVGSWHWEQMKNIGFENFNIPRKHWNQDTEIVSMPYEKFDHIGKVSWNLDNHGDRYSEVMRRRMYVKERASLYKDIDLKGKFI